MMTYVGITLILIGGTLAFLDRPKLRLTIVSSPTLVQPQPEWPELAPDGVTRMAGMNVWTKMKGEENKWVIWSRDSDGGVIWNYARQVEWEVPARKEFRFEEIEGLPWPR
jgi:hypothetical protein